MLRSRTAFTLVEVLVVIAVIGALVALSVPAVMASRESTRKLECASHEAQIGRAFHHRISLWNKTPSPQFVAFKLGAYMEDSAGMFACPAIEDSRGISYAVNKRVQKIKLGDTNFKIVLLDANEPLVDLVSDNTDWQGIVEPRHSDCLHVLYFDGHVESQVFTDLEEYVRKNPATSPRTEEEAQEIAERVRDEATKGGIIRHGKCPITAIEASEDISITIDGVTVNLCCQMCLKRLLAAPPRQRTRMVFNNDNGVWSPP